MESRLLISVCESGAGERIDKFLTNALSEEGLSRSRLQKMIDDGNVTVNDKTVEARYRLKEGDAVAVLMEEPEEYEVLPQDMQLEILYEDEDVIVVNKPKHMVVHPDQVHHENTLVNGLLFHCKDLSGINGVLRPGIVHRIDMDTTGSVIACKNDRAHASIAAQLKEHSINRRYAAIVCGVLKEDEGVIDAPIGRNEKDRKKMAINRRNGKNAVTHYKVLRRFQNFTYLECRLETGRTHQIRVHMASIGHPVLGDEVYGGVREKYKTEGQCLHARILGFVQPTSGEYIETEAPLPDYFVRLLEILP